MSSSGVHHEHRYACLAEQHLLVSEMSNDVVRLMWGAEEKEGCGVRLVQFALSALRHRPISALFYPVLCLSEEKIALSSLKSNALLALSAKVHLEPSVE